MHYKQLSYVAAIPIYEDLIGSKLESPQMLANLAFSHFQIGNMEKAVQYYQLAFSKESDLSAEWYVLASDRYVPNQTPCFFD